MEPATEPVTKPSAKITKEEYDLHTKETEARLVDGESAESISRLYKSFGNPKDELERYLYCIDDERAFELEEISKYNNIVHPVICRILVRNRNKNQYTEDDLVSLHKVISKSKDVIEKIMTK